MTKKHYEWMPGQEPPELGAHSIAKHDVLSAYLKKYVDVLVARPVQDKLKLTLVDGFSGGGIYRHWQTKERLSGSPLIMLDAMRTAEIKANIGRKKPFHLDVEFIFVDHAKPTVECLKTELHNHEAARHYLESTNVVCDNFSSQLDNIISGIAQRQRAGRAIFVLDQYGYTDVPMSDLRKIFNKLPKAEVILTIATDWLIDGWQDGTARNLGLEFPSGFLDTIKLDNPADWRRQIQFHLHKEFLTKSGASYYTPFFVVSPKAHRCYWLLHFSTHPKARDVMMQLHWQLENHFEHYGGPAFYMLGYHPRRDDERLGFGKLPFGFDSFAEQESNDALAIELPRIIAEFSEGVSFGEFFKRVVNDTPATKSMLEKVIRGLTCEKELELLTEEGKLRKNGVKISDSDIVRFPRQTRILF